MSRDPHGRLPAYGAAVAMDGGDLPLKHQVRASLEGRSRHIHTESGLVCAAVLVPLLLRQGKWHVLLTQRTQTVEHHKGQVSFPGGTCDARDSGLLATALREAYEEVGIPPEAVEVLGALDDLPTISNFVITPFVGVVAHPYSYRVNAHEVESVVEVPLDFLLEPGNLRVEQREVGGQLYELLFWEFGEYTIWGATARILRSLLELMSGSTGSSPLT